MRVIPINIPQGFLIDSEDYSLIFGRSVALAGKGYVVVTARNKKEKFHYLHRAVMSAPRGLMVDHINGDKLDNRKSNLRLVTRSQNQTNSMKQRSCGSKYKGVYLDKRRALFASEITVEGKRKFLGYFVHEKRAAIAYDRAARVAFGAYARLNIPVENERGCL